MKSQGCQLNNKCHLRWQIHSQISIPKIKHAQTEKEKRKKTQTSKFKKDEITSKQFFESRIRV